MGFELPRCHYCDRIAELDYEDIHVCVQCTDALSKGAVYALWKLPWDDWCVAGVDKGDMDWIEVSRGKFSEMWELMQRQPYTDRPAEGD